MESALFVLRRFPPPAASSDILAWLDRTGARFAADAGKALVVKLVIRETALFNVLPHLIYGPTGERVQLEDASVRFVNFYERELGSGNGLLPSESGDPSVGIGEGSSQGFDFTNTAALVTVID
jgi:hypothetical protein